MNQSTRRKTRHLLHFLLTWVVIGSQIALPLGALLAAVQPTPQMAQAVAQQAGFGDWLAQRAGDLTAWAQPLWGVPKSTQAAPLRALSDLSGNVATPWVQSTFQVSATTDRTPDVLCTGLTCPTISNPNNTTDSTTTNYAAISFPVLAVFASASIRVTESDDDYAAGTFAGFKIAKVGGLLDLSLFDNITIRTYLNGTQKETKSGTSIIDGSLLGLIGGGSVSEYVVGFWTTQAFDAVEIYQAQPIGLNLGGETRIFHAVLEKAEAGPALTCNAGVGTNWLKPLYPVRLNDAATGVTGICAGCSVDGASNVIDSNSTNYANINVGIGLAGGGQIAAYDPLITSYPAGTFAGFVVEDTGGLGASLLDAFVLETYLDGAQQQSIAAGSLIDFPFFSGKKTIGFTTSQAFDEVRIRAVSLASLNVNLRVYQALLAPAGCTMTGPRGPGGVTDNLAAWYKADGTVGATQWDDESGNGRHMLAAGDGTAARMPTLDATPGAANNFNPRVAFLSNADGNRKWTMTAAGNNVFANTSTPGTIFNISSFPDETVYDVPQMYAFEDDDPGLNLITDRNAANDIRVIFQRDNGGTGSAGWDFVVPGVSQTQPLLTAHAWNYAAGGNTFSFNGYDYTPSSNPFIGATSPRYMFGSELTVAAGEAHSGYTSENIVYSTNWPSNSDERKRINSYLAIKYGITLLGTGTLAGGAADATFGGTADYLNSASTVIWNGTTTNSTYHNNVAGIGRDDASALNQKQSTSANSGFQPIIGLGTIAASNAANSNTFSADQSFIVWGSSSAATSFGTAYTPTSYSPTTGYFRMTRIWKVQETGTIGSVQVQGPANANLLLVDDDGNFSNGGTTEVPLTSGLGTVNFTSGQFFTFGAELTAPGGVAANLVQWHKADAEVFSDVAGTVAATASSNVKLWKNVAQDAYHPSDSAGGDPTYQAATATSNYNPSIFINKNENDYLKYVGRVMPAASNGSVFIIGRIESFNDDIYTSVGYGDNANDPAFDIDVDGGIPYWDPWFDGSSPANNDTNFPVDNNTTHLMGVTYQNNVADSVKKRVTGKEITTNLEVNSSNSENFDDFWIGSDGGGERWNGTVNEIVTYDRLLTGTDLAKVESYLAIKWGLTLDADPASGATNYDYLSAAGTTIWAGNGVNSGYHNNIAGIGRDDAAALDQRKSNSINSGFQPIIDNGAAFTADQSFLVWGSDSGAASFGTAYAPTSYSPTTGYFRMTRIWKVQETGTIGSIQVQGPANANLLLVDDDGNFSNGGTTEVPLTSGLGAVDFTSGQFFTFGAELTAPGGVAANLVQWHKADVEVFSDVAGTVAATTSSNVKLWKNVAQDAYHPSDSAGGDPTYQAAAAASNYNPSVFINKNENDYLKYVGRVMPANSNLSMFFVGRLESFNDDIYTGVAYGDNANDPALDVDVDGSVPYWDPWLDGSSPANNDTTFPVANNATHLLGVTAQNGVTDDLKKRGNGQQVVSNLELTSNAENFDDFWIGSDGGGERWNGTVNEIVTYDRLLTGADLAKVESYLAIKWGLTLDADPASGVTNYDYLSADGTTIWDGNGANSGYHNNIAGIGRDDAAALDQRKSNSINSGSQPIIDNGAAFTANESFLLWGSDTGAISLSANYNGGTNNRLARVWKVQETGTVGTVKVQIPTATAAGLQSILVHTVNTFGTVDRSYALTVVGSNYEANVNFNNNDFFTFSTNPPTAATTTIEVNTTADNTTAGDSNCTLREAITNANNNNDTTGGDCLTGSAVTTDTVTFNIPGAGPHTIAPTSALPSITGATTIDGSTQPSASCGPTRNLLIVLNGAAAGGATDGLRLTGNGVTVRGLVIQQFGQIGVKITSNNNVLECNNIGTNAAGTAAQGNGVSGVVITSPATNNRIGTNGDGANDANERNLISGNGSDGVSLAASGNVIAGNYIGTDVNGTVDLGNTRYGVGLDQAVTTNNRIGTDGNGTGDAAERNLISGNNQHGVQISASASGNVVAGNYIGTDVNGTTALGNTQSGVQLQSAATNNHIGTNGDGVGDAAEGNLISGNGQNGVLISGAGGNHVAGNYIGTAANGTTALANTQNGVLIQSSATNNIIGTAGTGAGDAAKRNVIAGNGESGVMLSNVGTTGNVVAGNYIGTDVNGTADLGNTDNGVYLNGAPNNRIGTDGNGTSDDAERNIIAGNGLRGVFISGANSTNTIVAGNYIGTDVNGTAAIANSQHGIVIISSASNNRIGTNGDGNGDAAERNLISGNSPHGIFISGAGASNNVIAGNYIGVAANGTSALGNAQDGIYVNNGDNNRIGTNGDGNGDAAERNVISGNPQYGVNLSSNGNVVAGNYIGVDASGVAALGNSHAVVIAGGSNNRIGGSKAVEGNILAYSTDANGDGVWVSSGTSNDNAILGNSIFGNSGLGIDLGANGVTANDTGDNDIGSNDLLNHPVIRSVSGTTVNLAYAVPAGNYLLQIYDNPTGLDTTKYGEGETLVFTKTVAITAGGMNDTAILSAAPSNSGQRLAATLTEDLGGGAYGATSEFSGPDSVANHDTFTVTVNSTGNTLNLTANDTTAWYTDTLTISSVGVPTGGTVTGFSSGAVTYNGPATPGNYSFIYIVRNTAGVTDTATVTVTVNAANIAPTITNSGSVSIPENTTVVTTVTASGTAPITYSIVGGADAAKFTIDPNTGALSFVAAPDFENPTDSGGNNVYEVTVRASNSAGTDDQAIAVTVTDVLGDVPVTLQVKVLLQGAYDSASGLLRDDLRSQNLLPSTSPYAAAATANAGVFAVTGNNAIVDWVLVELRDSTTPATVVASQSALLQRDGDVVAVDGTSTLTFTVGAPSYYVAVKHRNHLGAMTAAPVALSAATPLVDFTVSAGYGTNGQAMVGSVYALWMGNTSGDNQVIGAGPGNDRNAILSEALAAPGNTNHNTNYIVNGYSDADVNLDGRVIAAGPGNDINFILYTIFAHPGNGSAAANFVVQGQVP